MTGHSNNDRLARFSRIYGPVRERLLAKQREGTMTHDDEKYLELLNDVLHSLLPVAPEREPSYTSAKSVLERLLGKKAS